MVDERSLSRLRWRCRRGLLENDLLIERWFAGHPAPTLADAQGLGALMELDDLALLDLLLGRQEPTGDLDRPEVRQVLNDVRMSVDEAVRTAAGDGGRTSPQPVRC